MVRIRFRFGDCEGEIAVRTRKDANAFGDIVGKENIVNEEVFWPNEALGRVRDLIAQELSPAELLEAVFDEWFEAQHLTDAQIRQYNSGGATLDELGIDAPALNALPEDVLQSLAERCGVLFYSLVAVC